MLSGEWQWLSDAEYALEADCIYNYSDEDDEEAWGKEWDQAHGNLSDALAPLGRLAGEQTDDLRSMYDGDFYVDLETGRPTRTVGLFFMQPDALSVRAIRTVQSVLVSFQPEYQVVATVMLADHDELHFIIRRKGLLGRIECRDRLLAALG